jgi:hypothetical protein
MAARLTEIVVDSTDPRSSPFSGVRCSGGRSPTMHLDVNPSGVEQDVEVDRLLALGAKRVDVGQADDVPWVVLADAEGNEFCLLGRRLD